MAKVQIGEYADIRLNAYPDRLLKARISNILPTLDRSSELILWQRKTSKTGFPGGTISP